MAEQKLPKLPTFADFRHRRCKLGQKRARQIKGLRIECKPHQAIAFREERMMDRDKLAEMLRAGATAQAFTEEWFDMLGGYLRNHSYLARHADMIVAATRNGSKPEGRKRRSRLSAKHESRVA